MSLEIDGLNEVIAVKESFHGTALAGLEDRPALLCECGIAQRRRHRFTRAQSSEIECADEGVGAVIILVVGLVLSALDQAIGVAILLDQELERLADVRPVPPEKSAVWRAEMLTVSLQDIAALRIAGPKIVVASKPDGSGVRVEPGANGEVLHLTDRPLEVGEQPRHGVFVVPDMAASAVATAATFPTPEPAILPPLGGGGSES